MPSLLINPPFTTYTDLNGEPLEAGYIYIGTSGLEPSTNPINVYWDQAQLYPAAQPIRTVAGSPSRDGSPAVLYIESAAYSIKVEDKDNNLVFSRTTVPIEPITPDSINSTEAFLFPTMLSLKKGTDIADAAALVIPDDGNYFEALGTTTVTSINTINNNNTIFRIRWMGVRILTHNATTFDLLGKANITTEVGAESTFIEYSTGNFRMIHYQPGSISPALPMTLDSTQTVTGDKTFNGATNVDASTFRVFDNVDNTKKIAFDASNIATGTTRTTKFPNADMELDFGTFTPTGTAVANVDSTTPGAARFMRIGNVVTVSGFGFTDVTAANALTTVRYTLPIASNFTAASDLAGTGYFDVPSPSAFGMPMTTTADSTNDEAQISFYNPVGGTTGVKFFTYMYTYTIL
jgi:hypothetical protein